MADPLFPQSPVVPRRPPPSVEQVVRRAPLASIHEVLKISIHDVINDPRCRRTMAELYRLTRRIQNEIWLRRQLGEL